MRWIIAASAKRKTRAATIAAQRVVELPDSPHMHYS
jgi:hypothetical protein